LVLPPATATAIAGRQILWFLRFSFHEAFFYNTIFGIEGLKYYFFY